MVPGIYLVLSTLHSYSMSRNQYNYIIVEYEKYNI